MKNQSFGTPAPDCRRSASGRRQIGTDGAFLKPSMWQKTYPLSTSREWDSESLTYGYRPRQYNPYIGRFNRRDPIGYGDGINLYTYVRNNVTNYADPAGLKWGTSDFVWHYYFGCGKPVNIGDKNVDLLGDYKKDTNVTTVKFIAESKVRQETFRLAKGYAESWRFIMGGDEGVYVTTIYVLAGGYLNYLAVCDYTAEAKKESSCKCVKTNCSMEYWFRDSFEDPELLRK